MEASSALQCGGIFSSLHSLERGIFSLFIGGRTADAFRRTPSQVTRVRGRHHQLFSMRAHYHQYTVLGEGYFAPSSTDGLLWLPNEHFRVKPVLGRFHIFSLIISHHQCAIEEEESPCAFLLTHVVQYSVVNLLDGAQTGRIVPPKENISDTLTMLSAE